MRDRRRVHRAIVVLLGVSAVLAACSPRGRQAAPDPAGTADLKIVRVLDHLAVEGFTLQPAESGLHDVAAAANLGADPSAERAALEENRFAHAYLKLYTRGEYSVGVLAYEFRSSEGATGYMRYTLDDARRNHGATFFNVPSIDDARGQTQRNESDGFYLRAVAFPRDTVLYSVVIAGPKVPAATDVVGLAETLEGLVERTS
jgi:hypothetical protein